MNLCKIFSSEKEVMCTSCRKKGPLMEILPSNSCVFPPSARFDDFAYRYAPAFAPVKAASTEAEAGGGKRGAETPKSSAPKRSAPRFLSGRCKSATITDSAS